MNVKYVGKNLVLNMCCNIILNQSIWELKSFLFVLFVGKVLFKSNFILYMLTYIWDCVFLCVRFVEFFFRMKNFYENINICMMSIKILSVKYVVSNLSSFLFFVYIRRFIRRLRIIFVRCVGRVLFRDRFFCDMNVFILGINFLFVIFVLRILMMYL